MSRFSLRASACFLSALLLPAAIHFWGPLVVLALSPAVAAFCLGSGGWRLLLLAVATGFTASFLVQHTLWVVSLGGVVLLSLYQALTWVPVAFGVREVWRRWRVPLALAWPVAWGAGEALRSLGPLGTIFGILTVPETTQPWMLQVADLGGYGLATLPLAMLQGWFADCLLLTGCHDSRAARGGSALRRRFATGCKSARLRLSTASLAVVWLLVAIYGHWRIAQIEGGMQAGPSIAVIQPDVIALPGDARGYDEARLLAKLKALSEAAVASEPRTELVVWPEGIARRALPNRGLIEAGFDPRMREFLIRPGETDPEEAILRDRWAGIRRDAAARNRAFEEWVATLGVPLIVGTEAWVPTPPEAPTPSVRQNVALRFDPNLGQDETPQAKIRLYPLGEYAPFKESPVGPLLESLIGPPRNEYSPGQARQLEQLDGDGPSYVISICSELKFSQLDGTFPETPARQKPFDFMINIANEGLFQRNGMLEIFAFCAGLRAIENRVSVVRSSNAGISGFWSPTGKAYGQVTNGRRQSRTGLGAPEIPFIMDLLEFRRGHEDAFASDPELREALEARIEHINALRQEAGVEGWSVQPVYLAAGTTLFQRWGDWLTPTLIAALAMMNGAYLMGARRHGS
ncbi:MAG: hypothetical protein R6U56_06220 [Opitutales bacterium]